MKPKVLLVDDETDFAELLEYNLCQQGFEMFTAVNGMEALHQARRLLPDVILLDLMLPDLDGFSVYEILRSQPSTATIPVIIISALSGPSVCGRSIATGVNCFFKKPVDMKALGDSVRGLCEEHQELSRLRLDRDPNEAQSGSETPAR